MSSDGYTYRAEWSALDGEYAGLVAEFPSLSWLEPTEAEALAGIQRLVDEVVADLVANDEPVPTPRVAEAFHYVTERSTD